MLLDGRDWLVGAGPTIADVDLYGIAAYAPQAGMDLGPYPVLRKWMAKVEACRASAMSKPACRSRP